MAQRYDLVLKGGEVLDPSQGLRGVQDVAFRDGKVAEIVPGSAVDGARQVIDVSGKLVTPGLIDVHGHYYNHVVPFATAADEVCLPNGVTTTVDAGSSGWTHFDGFREYILTREKTRLMALVNLSALGMLDPHRDGGFGPTTMTISGGPKTMFPDNAAGELMHLRFAQVEETIRCIKDNPNVAIGVKIRLDVSISGEANSIPALERARQVADATGTFIMVHVARVPIPMARVFEYLRPGDIVTHIFHSAENSILDATGNVRTEVLEAKSKGIVMDIGAIRGNFGLNVSQAAIGQRMLPDTISTDLSIHKHKPGPPPYVLPDLMSLFMGIGMSLEEVVTAVTETPAKAIGEAGTLGTLRAGAVGDAAVLELVSGDFTYDDGEGVEVTTKQRIAPVMTIKDGKVWKPDPA